MRERRAQEEMVGFVLIVVLIIIISLVFLGFSLRQKPKLEVSTTVDNLLSAMLLYTTDCALYIPQYETVKDVMKSCYYNEICSDGKSACTELREVMDKLLRAAEGDLSSNSDKPIKAYELNVSYSAKQQGFIARQPEAGLLYIKNGVCTSESAGAQQFVPLEAGNIVVSLKFCY